MSEPHRYDTSLQELAATVTGLQTGVISVTEGAQRLKTQYAVMSSHLPPRFQEVLDEILDRLESGALFTEESCSFSQGELLAHLQVWFDKLDQRLRSPS